MRWTLFCEASALLSKLLSAGAAGDYDYSGADTNSGARARSSAVELRTFNPGVVGSNPTGPSIYPCLINGDGRLERARSRAGGRFDHTSGHNAWVVGAETVTGIDWSGPADYAKRS